MVYNAALILSFINNPTVQAEKLSCEIRYNIGCCQRAKYALGNGMEEAGLLVSDPSFPLTDALRVSAAFKPDLKHV